MYVVHVANSELICILRFLGETNPTGPSLSVASMNQYVCRCFKFHVRNLFLESWQRSNMIFQNQKHMYTFHVLHFIRVTHFTSTFTFTFTFTRFFPKVSLFIASPLATSYRLEDTSCGWNFHLTTRVLGSHIRLPVNAFKNNIRKSKMLRNLQIFHLVSFGSHRVKYVSTMRFYKTREKL
jgi:hypothetical protein